MIGATVRRLPLWQRVALLLIFVVLADFSAADGCDCGPNDLTTTAQHTTTKGTDHGV